MQIPPAVAALCRSLEEAGNVLHYRSATASDLVFHLTQRPERGDVKDAKKPAAAEFSYICYNSDGYVYLSCGFRDMQGPPHDCRKSSVLPQGRNDPHVLQPTHCHLRYLFTGDSGIPSRPRLQRQKMPRHLQLAGIVSHDQDTAAYNDLSSVHIRYCLHLVLHV